MTGCFRIFATAGLACAFEATLPAQPPMHLTLADAQRVAVQNNPQFASARLTAAAAYQVPLEYRSAYSPSFSGAITTVGADSGSRLAAGALNNPSVYNRAASGLIANQLITDFGRTSNLVGTAELRAKAQDQAAETTRADILLATSEAYFNLLHALAVVKVADQTVEQRQLVVDQVTALFEGQRKSQLDVSFAQVNLSDAKLLQVQAGNDVKAATAQLASVLGVPNQTSFALDEEPLPSAIPDPVETFLQQAIQNRPELKDLRLEQSAAERFVKAEHALYYPNLGFVGSAGLAPVGDPAISKRYGAIGFNINIPIFNGGLFHARTTEASLHAQAAAKNLTAEEYRIARDVRVAYLSATNAYQKLTLTKQLLQQAELAQDLAQSRYSLGLSTIVELSQAQLNLTSAQLTDTSARYDYQVQRINVDFQAGMLH
jgi:outer membrane protein